MKTYDVHVSYVVKKRVGGRNINSSGGTQMNIRAASEEGIVLGVVKKLQKFHKGVVTEFTIITVK